MESPARSTALLRDQNLLILFSVTLVAVGNVSSVSPAFPEMMTTFSVGETEIGWIVTAYSLPGALSAPFIGVLADRFGRRRVLALSLTGFSLAGAACMTATSFPMLLGFRLVQGTCAGPLVALSVTLIGDRYDGGTRATAIGYNATVLNIGTTAYPVVGGLLAGIAWYWPFALPLLALPVALAVWMRLDTPTPDAPQTLRAYLRDAWTGLQDPAIVALLLANTGVFILLFGVLLTYVPVLVDNRFAAVPFVVGGILAGASAASGLTASQTGRLTQVFSARTIILGSFGLYAAACIGIALAPNVWTLIAATVVFGTAQGLNRPAIQTRLVNLAPAATRSVTLSLNATALRVGQALGPLVMGGLLLLGGLSLVFWGGALLAVAMGLALRPFVGSPT